MLPSALRLRDPGFDNLTVLPFFRYLEFSFTIEKGNESVRIAMEVFTNWD